MSLPTPEEPSIVEKRIGVRELSRLGAVLVRELGTVGGSDEAPTARIERSVDAACLMCGIRVTGAELLSASLPFTGEGGDGLSEKVRRVRLGYCARKTCSSEFYMVRLLPIPGFDWNPMWDRTELALGEAAPIPEARGSRGEPLALLLAGLLRRVRSPVPLAVLGVLVLMLWMRSGFRVPGISPAPRVFVVPQEAPPVRPAPGR
ncbi:MAG: hypothetical protein AB7O66_09430 [Limisphaerales bacterium]